MKIIIATAALVATAVANSFAAADTLTTAQLHKAFIPSEPWAKVVNRCSYPVYIWSINKAHGCGAAVAMKLNTGELYNENLRNGSEFDDGGIAIKLSKYDTCGGKDITQLEYKLDYKEGYSGNYLDMSFVDCTSNLEDCPGRTDGFYLKSGNQGGNFPSAVDNEHCPIFKVNDAEEAAKVSYINWDDRQTKYCNERANLALYLCGGNAPEDEDETPAPEESETPSPSPSSSQAESTPVPTSTASKSRKAKPTAAAPSSTEEAFVVAAAAVTEAPAPPAVAAIKTEVVYVTEYVNKRHAHGRRHQHFHA